MAGTGSIVSDFNRDGYPDLFFFCHRADGSFDEVGKFGDHHTPSLLYWGSAEGFRETNRLAIPSVGAHYDVGVDLGHIRDRKFEFEYTSSPHNSGGKKPVRLRWHGETPGQTSIKFQLRMADSKEALKKAEWLGAEGKGSFFPEREQSVTSLPAKKWLQYKAILNTGNGASSPVLDEVEILFQLAIQTALRAFFPASGAFSN